MHRTEIDFESVEYVLDNLREEDKIECINSRGINYKDSILNDLKNTKNKFLLAKTKKDNIPVLIAGAWAKDNVNTSVGIVWLLSTKEIEKHQISFLKEMKKEIEEYDKEFAILFNEIYKSNHLAKKWLKWVGFRFPKSETKKTFLDKAFLSIETEKDFEIFYRERKVKGLGE